MIIHPKFRAEQLTSLAKPHQSWGMLGVFKHLKSSKHPETSGVHLANHYIFVVFFKRKPAARLMSTSQWSIHHQVDKLIGHQEVGGDAQKEQDYQNWDIYQKLAFNQQEWW
jgi:hypothetical protein